MFELGDISALAIDGGGTRSRFACLLNGQRFETELGAANAFSDFEGAVLSLNNGLHDIAAKCALTLEELGSFPAFVGLAGMIDAGVADRIASRLPLVNAEFADDRRSALRGAFGENDGLLAHCGTGSFLASSIDGQIKLAGGWGYDLGDEASAQWVGRTAISQTLRQIDGFEEQTALHKTLVERFGGASGILRFAASASPGDYGGIAPLVTTLAAEGDKAAIAIMQRGSDYISDSLDQMGWIPGRAICLTGGIAPHYATYLPINKQNEITKPRGTPLDGALELACERYWEQRNGDR